MKVILTNPLLVGSFLLLIILLITGVIACFLFLREIKKYTLQEAHELARERSKRIMPLAIAIIVVDIFGLTVVRQQYEGKVSFQTAIWIVVGVSAFFLFFLSIDILGMVLAKKRIRELELPLVAEGHLQADQKEQE